MLLKKAVNGMLHSLHITRPHTEAAKMWGVTLKKADLFVCVLETHIPIMWRVYNNHIITTKFGNLKLYQQSIVLYKSKY